MRFFPGLHSLILDPHDLAVRPTMISGASIRTIFLAKLAAIGQAEYSTPFVQKNRPVRVTTKSAIVFANAKALGCISNFWRNKNSGRMNSSVCTIRLAPEKGGQSTLFWSGPG